MKATLLLVVAAILGSCCLAVRPVKEDLVLDVPNVADDRRVDVSLIVRSRCSDSLKCEAQLDAVLRNLHSIVDVKIDYIADNITDHGITCEHGPIECAGNTQQLCVQQYTSRDDNYDVFWQFLKCVNQNVTTIGDPTRAAQCLTLIGTDERLALKIKRCWSGREGYDLFRRSAKYVEAKSVPCCCNIFIEGKFRCNVAHGAFQECPGGSKVEDFEASICSSYLDVYRELPAVCPQISTSRH